MGRCPACAGKAKETLSGYSPQVVHIWHSACSRVAEVSIADFVARYGLPNLGDRYFADGKYSRYPSNAAVFTLNGVTKTLTEWARDLGVSRQVLEQRLIRKWPLARVLSKKVRGSP